MRVACLVEKTADRMERMMDYLLVGMMDCLLAASLVRQRVKMRAAQTGNQMVDL